MRKPSTGLRKNNSADTLIQDFLLSDCDKIIFSCLNHPACSLYYGSPRNLTQMGKRIVFHSFCSLVGFMQDPALLLSFVCLPSRGFPLYLKFLIPFELEYFVLKYSLS